MNSQDRNPAVWITGYRIDACPGRECACMRYRPWEQRYPGYHALTALNITAAELVDALERRGLLSTSDSAP